MRDEHRLSAGWWTAILITFIVGAVLLSGAMFSGTFNSYVPVTLTSDRSGLVMEAGSKVKLRGVQVGRVGAVQRTGDHASLTLDLYPDEVANIPANVGAEIEATTAFGAKYVNLIPPTDPSPHPLTAGSVLVSRNVSTEINTVFESLVATLRQIDPAKLNATLTALADGLGGQGDAIGQATTSANHVLTELNSRTGAIQQDFRSLKGATDTYGAAAQDIMSVLDSASTISATIANHASSLDTLLLNVIGLSRSGIAVLGPNQNNLVHAINVLEPTTDLLLEYNPEYTCMLVGAKRFLDGAVETTGGNGYSAVLDTGLLFGDDVYRYPEHLPVVNAKGGPGGKPSCGALPNADEAFPVQLLIADTGYGTNPGDIRMHPGAGHPFYVDYLPSTRAVPEPPSYRGENPRGYVPPLPGPDPAVPPSPVAGAPVPALPAEAAIPPQPAAAEPTP